MIPDIASFGAIASGLELDVMTLQRLLAAYMEYMPTMARWQAELMLADLDRHGLVTDSVSVMKDVPILVRDAMTKQIPQLVSSQMTRALSAVSMERVDATGAVLKTCRLTRSSLCNGNGRLSSVRLTAKEWRRSMR